MRRAPEVLLLLAVPAAFLGGLALGGRSSPPPGPAPARAGPPDAAELVLELFDVKDMTVPIRSFPGGWEPAGDPYEPPVRFDGAALAELIRATIDPEVFSAGGAVDWREGGILVVKAPPATGRRIGRFLDRLRSAARAA